VERQAQLYASLGSARLDAGLSWSERELPQHERTKHVHRLHPYLGKFVPQLVELFLRRHFVPGARILDPFAGSGTTLVECSTFGAHSIGVDISAFNALLATAKTRRYDVGAVERDLGDVLARLARLDGGAPPEPAGEYLTRWYDPRALAELLWFRETLADYPQSVALLQVVLARAARSARLTTHFELDFPTRPQDGPYECRKHRRICRPTREAAKFLRRYLIDTMTRVRAYAELRRDVDVVVHHGDARDLDYGQPLDGIITSPPYPGRIDYHDQHRYAFELLGLADRGAEEIGAPARGRSRAAAAAYADDVVAVFANARRFLRPGAPVVVVIDDPAGSYGDILERAGLTLVERRRRHVNRRTGQRSGEFFEEILLAAA
jgi:hypothetical protein